MRWSRALLVSDEAGLAVATRALDALHPMPIRTAAFVSAEPGDDVLRLARSHDTDLVVLEAPPDAGAFGDDLAAVLERSPADVALAFAPASPAAPGGGVLVPFGGGEHDWTAVELGAWLAVATGERLRVAGPRADPRRGGRDASRLLADASLAVQQLVGVVAEPALVEATRARAGRGGRRRERGRGRAVSALAAGGGRRGAPRAGALARLSRARRPPRAAAERDRAAGECDAVHLVDRRQLGAALEARPIRTSRARTACRGRLPRTRPG